MVLEVQTTLLGGGGKSEWKGTKWDFKDAKNVRFLDLNCGYIGVMTLRQLTKLYAYDLCAFLLVRYTLKIN